MVFDRVYGDGAPCPSSYGSSDIGSDYHDIRIPGMESVVASITGYDGDEKSRLINNINSSGGFYVGSLRKGSTTHLVCKTFSGKKYEMAKRFGIHIINHRWFEDCIEAGRRLSERSYTSLSGKDVGTVSCKQPKQESDFARSGKLDSPKTVTFDKHLSPSYFGGEDFCQKTLNHKYSTAPDKSYVLDDIIDSEYSDQDLETLLQNSLKKRDKGKHKVIKNQSFKYKMPKKCTRRPLSSPIQPFKSSNKVSINQRSDSILNYMSISDESDTEMKQENQDRYQDVGIQDGKRSPNAESLGCVFLEDTQEASPVTSSRRSLRLKGKQLSLSKFISLHPKRKQRSINRLPDSCYSNIVATESEGCRNLAASISPSLTAATSSREIPKDNSLHLPVGTGASCGATVDIVEESHVACTLVPSDIACVICHADKITSAEGLLMCGHNFCYLCLKKWATEVSSKNPTCPLCKMPFDMITKREQRLGQNGEESSFEESIVLLECREDRNLQQVAENIARPTCIMCGIGDMEEMLMICSECGARSAHSFCLDPPLPPPVATTLWFCGRCSQRRRVDTSWWYQLHDIQRLGD